MVKQATKEALILILVSIGVAVVVYGVRTDKIKPVSITEKNSSNPQQSNEAVVTEIPLYEAVRLFKEKSAIFADARNPLDFEAGHIKGAVNLYLPDQDGWLPDFPASTDPTAIIITYCDGDACHLAPDLAEILFFNGFDQVHYLKNGWSLWNESGHPVE